MSEKRKPCITLVAKKSGKQNRLELFSISKWPGVYEKRLDTRKRYRVRVNGKWSDKGDQNLRNTYTVTSVLAQLRKLLKSRN